MSVLSPIVDTWDGANRRIYLKEGVGDYYPIEDLYHEYRNERRLNEGLRKFDPLLRAEGNISKGGGAFTPRYVVLMTSPISLVTTKIIPFNETKQLNQLGDMITDIADTDPDLYDISQLTVPKPIFIKPSEAETIQLNSEAIVYSSFQGMVWFDANSPYGDKGSAAEPNGNAERPVNTIPLAVEIAVDRGFEKIHICSDVTISSSVDLDNYVLVGHSYVLIQVIIEANANVQGIRIIDCDISGVMDGDTLIEKCVVQTITYVNGKINYCSIAGNITLAGSKDAEIKNCSQDDMNIEPEIDMGGSGQNLVMPNYAGIVHIRNMNGANKVGIGLNSGKVVLHSDSVLSGHIHVSGVGELVDESGDSIPSGTWNTGVTVINTAINTLTMNQAVWKQIMDGTKTGEDVLLETRKYALGAKNKLF